MKIPAIQIGTRCFLQPHADLFLSEGSPVRGGLTIEDDHGDWEFATPDDRIRRLRLEDRQRKRFDLVLDLRNGGGV